MLETTIKKLKPCPFCGREVETAEMEWCPAGATRLKVYCRCGADVETSAESIYYVDGLPTFGGLDAIAKWNNRSEK